MNSRRLIEVFLKCATLGLKDITSQHRLFRARLSARGHEPVPPNHPRGGMDCPLCDPPVGVMPSAMAGYITALSKVRQCFCTAKVSRRPCLRWVRAAHVGTSPHAKTKSARPSIPDMRAIDVGTHALCRWTKSLPR